MSDATVAEAVTPADTPAIDPGLLARLRALDLSDRLVAWAAGCSRQYVHLILGPRPPKEPAPVLATPDDDDANALPGVLMDFRRRHALTQAQLAVILGIKGVDVISRWENGRGGCSLPLLVMRYLKTLDAKGKV